MFLWANEPLALGYGIATQQETKEKSKRHPPSIPLGDGRRDAVDGALGIDLAVESGRGGATVEEVAVDGLVVAHAEVVVGDALAVEEARVLFSSAPRGKGEARKGKRERETLASRRWFVDC